MRRRWKLFSVLVAAFVLAACGMIILNRLDSDLQVLEDTARETRLRQISAEKENGALTQEIKNKDTDSYIMEKARTLYGYLMPGEIRFVVTNPEALGDNPADAVTEVTP